MYCWVTFKEIETLMGQTPVSQPTMIYSDTFIIEKGQLYANTFLSKRLRQLNVPFQENTEGFSWQARLFSHPLSVVAGQEHLIAPAGAQISISVLDGRISSIRVDEEERESLALEPLMIGQIAGAYSSIRDYVSLDNVPTVLKEAIISIEDQRFRDHIGFDIKSLLRAFWINIRRRALTQGGSTITQQLVKNLALTNKKTISRKIRELVLAVLIEIRYEKEKILEKYLNEVYFGQIGSLEIHGVVDAAKYFFNKPLDKLNNSEMALLAGLIRGPAYYSPYRHKERALARKNTVLQKLAEQHYIAEDELAIALTEPILFAPPTQGRNIAPYFVDYVKAQVLEQLKDRINQEDLGAEGLRIYTTLDPVLQDHADHAVATSIESLESRLKIPPSLRLEGLLVSAHSQSGFIRALVGGRSYSSTTFNRVLNMKRQAGSTFKPFVYLAAFVKGQNKDGEPYRASTLLDDKEFEYTYEGGQTWKPQNYDRNFRGKITLREALIHSVNIPATKVAVDVGIADIIDTAHRLGIKSTLPEVPSLSLGAADVEATELLQAYSTIANLGLRTELTSIRLVTDKDGATLAHFTPVQQTIYEPGLFELLTDLLRDVCVNGTARSLPALGYKKPAFGKTGTTSFYRDSWFAGFSEGLTTVTWVGFDELKEAEDNKIKLTGTGAALPVWAAYYNRARPSPEVQTQLSYEHIQPVGIDFTKDCKATTSTPAEQERQEYYLPGTAPDECQY